MKTKLIFFTLIIFLSMFFAAICTAQTNECNTVSNPVQGVTFFYLSSPSKPFETLGTFKVKQKFTGEPKEQIETARKTALDKFPTANGIIFTDLNMQEAKAVKF